MGQMQTSPLIMAQRILRTLLKDEMLILLL